MQLELREFKLSQIKDDATIMIIGKRGVGKSTILRNIMHAKRHLPFGIACSGTEEGNGAFGKHMPGTFVYSDYDAKAVQRVIDRQRTLSNDDGATPSPVFIYLDDCLYDKGVMKRPEVRQIFLNGRHFKIFVAVTAQFSGDIPPAIRSNIDYLFICRDPIIQNRRRIWENFFGLMEFGQFQQLMTKSTENFECLVLDNTSRSNDPSDAIYWYKAKTDLPGFKMGCRAYWQFGRQKMAEAREAAARGDRAKKRNEAEKKITVTIKKIHAAKPAAASKTAPKASAVAKKR